VLIPKSLLTNAVACILLGFSIGYAVSLSLSLYGVPGLFMVNLGNETIRQASSFSIFTSWVPLNLAYSLRAMGVEALPEVLVPSTLGNTTVLVRGVDPSAARAYGLMESELRYGVVIGSELVKKLGLSVGDVVRLTSFKGASVNATIVGTVYSNDHPQLNYEVITNLTLAQVLGMLPRDVVNLVILNASNTLLDTVSRSYTVNIMTNLHGELAVIDSMNRTVILMRAGNTTIQLPFGYYTLVIIDGGYRVARLLVNSDTTINMTEAPQGVMRPSYNRVGFWLTLTWSNGTPATGYNVQFRYPNGSLAYSTVTYGVAPIPLPPGKYEVVVSVDGLSQYYTINAGLGDNVSLTLTPRLAVESALANYAPLLTSRLGAIEDPGPAALAGALRISYSALLTLAMALAVALALGLVGIISHAYATNEDVANYLATIRAGWRHRLLLLDLPIFTSSSASLMIGLALSHMTWGYVASRLELLSTPLSLVKPNLASSVILPWLALIPIIALAQARRVDRG